MPGRPSAGSAAIAPLPEIHPRHLKQAQAAIHDHVR